MSALPATSLPAIPAEVEELLDEASVLNGPYSAQPMGDRIQLVETATRRVIREVIWPGAGQWASNVLRNALAANGGTT